MTAVRKGATRIADIPVDTLQALSQGEMQSANLVELLALDQAQLARTVFPDLPSDVQEEIDAACELGILKRIGRIGTILLNNLGTEAIETCCTHHSDTVRGWACFMIGVRPELDLPVRLTTMRTLADDDHFGVREWAWMAMRPHFIEKLDMAIAHLEKWTGSPSEYLRRFASESLRPRGVWCSHIVALKHEPARALPVLAPLCADPSIYVQDSVANWLNDAAKDQPDWVRDLCAQWLQTSPTDATRRICRRALRNLK